MIAKKTRDRGNIQEIAVPLTTAATAVLHATKTFSGWATSARAGAEASCRKKDRHERESFARLRCSAKANLSSLHFLAEWVVLILHFELLKICMLATRKFWVCAAAVVLGFFFRNRGRSSLFPAIIQNQMRLISVISAAQ